MYYLSRLAKAAHHSRPDPRQDGTDAPKSVQEGFVFIAFAEGAERYEGDTLQGTMVFRVARSALEMVPYDGPTIERYSAAMRLVCELAVLSVPCPETELCFAIAYGYHRTGHLSLDDLVVLRMHYAKVREAAATGSPIRRGRLLRFIQIREYFHARGLPVFNTG